VGYAGNIAGRKVITISRAWIARGMLVPEGNGKYTPADVRVVYGQTDDYADGIKLILESNEWDIDHPGAAMVALTERDLTSHLWGAIQLWDQNQKTFAPNTLQSNAMQAVERDNERIRGQVFQASAHAGQPPMGHNDYNPLAPRGTRHNPHGLGSYDTPPWSTVEPLRHTASRAPAPEWQDTVASLWEDEIYSEKEQTLCQPGVARSPTCTVEHAKPPNWIFRKGQ
jgi:hypothetical protein